MKNKAVFFISTNIYIKLSPFLLLYILITMFLSKPLLTGDEPRYLMFAHNLLSGHYSPPYPNINLWNGPGYPIFLLPAVALNLPYIFIKLFNSLLLYLSLICFYRAVSYYSNQKYSLIYTVILGSYFPIFQMLPFVLPEVLSWFLIALFAYLYVKICSNPSSFLKLFLCSLILSYLALTKVIFGYVIPILIIFILCLVIIKKREIYQASLKIFILSLVFCLPWLFYTYKLTGKIFYWANSGGLSLYAMSSLDPAESGDWFDTDSFEALPARKELHKAFFDSISKLDPIQKDVALKDKAIENIKRNPGKFVKNWIANVGRMLFSYPYSYAEQSIKTFFTLIPNMIIVVLIIFSIFSLIRKWTAFDKEILILLLFVIVYLAESSLLSAYRRQFYITVPFWLFFFSYELSRIVSIRFRYGVNSGLPQ